MAWNCVRRASQEDYAKLAKIEASFEARYDICPYHLDPDYERHKPLLRKWKRRLRYHNLSEGICWGHVGYSIPD